MPSTEREHKLRSVGFHFHRKQGVVVVSARFTPDDQVPVEPVCERFIGYHENDAGTLSTAVKCVGSTVATLKGSEGSACSSSTSQHPRMLSPNHPDHPARRPTSEAFKRKYGTQNDSSYRKLARMQRDKLVVSLVAPPHETTDGVTSLMWRFL